MVETVRSHSLFGMMPERKTGVGPSVQYAVVLLEILAIALLGVVAAVLRFGKLYLMPADVNELCKDSNYLRCRREAVIEVPSSVMAAIVIVAPPVLMLMLELVKGRLQRLRASSGKDDLSIPYFKRFAKLMLLFVLGMFLTSALTDFLRLFFSRPKPYFLCVYNVYCTDGPPLENDMSEAERAARLSFPCYSCTMLAYSGAVVAAHAELVLRALHGLCALRPILALVAFLPSLVVASQAVFTRENHWEDVAVGLILGAASGGYVMLVLYAERERTPSSSSASPPGPGPQPPPSDGTGLRMITLPRARLRSPSVEAINVLNNIPYMRQYSKRLDSEDSFY